MTDALWVLEQALQAAKSIEDELRRSRALRSVAEAMVKAGMKEEAQRVLQQALQVARSIWDATDRSLALRSVAEAMTKAGKWEQALQAAKKHGGRRQRRLKESDKIEMEAAR